MIVFVCAKCQAVFEADGLQIIAHGHIVGHVCPSCIANASSVLLILEQKHPGQFVLKVVEPHTEEAPKAPLPSQDPIDRQ